MTENYYLPQMPTEKEVAKILAFNKKILGELHSLLAQTSFRFSKDQGKLFENLVYTELLKQGFEIYYFNKDFECDFIAQKDGKIYAFQVCYELNIHNLEREINGLKKLPITCHEKTLLVYDKPLFDIEEKDFTLATYYEYFAQLN